MMTDEEHARRVAAMDRAAACPIPVDLSREVSAVIESHTMNVELDHGETMTAIEIAYPVIVDWLRAHPEALA